FRSVAERTPTGDSGWSTLEKDDVRLYLRAPRGIVIDACFDGAREDRAAVLAAFCRMAIGIPLDEIRDHGPLRLLHSLSDPSVAPPVRGLLTPENADPAFAFLAGLCRSLPRTGPSRWDIPPSFPW